jgi:hypothetical protein
VIISSFFETKPLQYIDRGSRGCILPEVEKVTKRIVCGSAPHPALGLGPQGYSPLPFEIPLDPPLSYIIRTMNE